MSRNKYPGDEVSIDFAQRSLMVPPGDHLLHGMGRRLLKSRRESIAKKVEHIVRAMPRGRLVQRFVLPLEWCPTMNVLLRRHFRTKKGFHDRIYNTMLNQVDWKKPKKVLEGRPLVRFVRFGLKPPDRDSSWTKVPLDVLVPSHMIAATKKRAAKLKPCMGYIEDDNPQAIDLQAWWEPSDMEHQHVYCDIWTG